MHSSASIHINRPREAVFEFMDIPENQSRITPRLSVETLGTLDNGGKHATYAYRLFGLSFEGAVRGIEHRPPERITFEMTGDIEGYIRWAFADDDDGTEVTYTAMYDVGLPPAVRWLFGPLIGRLNQRELKTTLETLRETVEAG